MSRLVSYCMHRIYCSLFIFTWQNLLFRQVCWFTRYLVKSKISSSMLVHLFVCLSVCLRIFTTAIPATIFDYILPNVMDMVSRYIEFYEIRFVTCLLYPPSINQIKSWANLAVLELFWSKLRLKSERSKSRSPEDRKTYF